MRVLIIDNNDSFTYNLVQIVEECGISDYLVVRNTNLDVDIAGNYSKILISPGPGIPSETSNIAELIDRYHKTKSILGICLGHQAIAEYFGAKLVNFQKPFHGVKSEIKLLETDYYLFVGLPSVIEGGRYHSWVVLNSEIPETLKITAVSTDGAIMGIAHKTFDIHGIQFHPESIMTPSGKRIINNWLYNKTE